MCLRRRPCLQGGKARGRHRHDVSSPPFSASRRGRRRVASRLAHRIGARRGSGHRRRSKSAISGHLPALISAAPREHTARRRPGRAFWLPGFGPTKALPGGGLRINAPFISPGDYFVGEVNYSHGAIRYNVNSASPNQTIVEGGNEAFGIASDCVYGGTVAAGTATGCQLTSAWNFNAG